MSEENAMAKRCRGILGLLLLMPVMLLAGCTAGETYRGTGSGNTYIAPLPPALQGTDPALRHWYTAPYFNPYEMP
jgi:hypothetical protein